VAELHNNVGALILLAIKAEKVSIFMEKSLKALQLDYVDQYLIHAPFGLDSQSDDDPIPIKDGEVVMDKNVNLEAVWAAMEDLVKAGKTKSIGLSNFDPGQIERIVKIAKVPVAVLQVEMHVYFQQKELREICTKHDIKVCAYSPLGSPGRKDFYNKLGLQFQENGLLAEPIVKKIATKYAKSPSQICLRFLVQLGVIAIPKSTNEQRLKENIEIFDFKLNAGEMFELQSLDKGASGRVLDFNFLPGIQKHPEFPKDMKH